MNYVLRDKKPVPMQDILEWAKEFEESDRRVAEDFLPDGTRISTVFLGIDHNFWGGPPLVFETMVFSSSENFREMDQDRYSTWEQAELGHKEMVQKWKEKRSRLNLLSNSVTNFVSPRAVPVWYKRAL